jgi:hypothetical protein
MIKLDMRGVCEERFEGLVYHQGASIRYERVEASNSCSRTLIIGFFSFIAFVKKIWAHFCFSWLSVLLPFSAFSIYFFITFHFPPSFSFLFCSCFF